MQVTCGSDWGLMNSSNRRSFSITLTDDDGEELAGESEWHDMSWKKRRAFLTMRADLEVLVYMVQADAITTEFAAARAADVKAKFEAVS